MTESVRLYAGRVIPAKQFTAQRQNEAEVVASRETAADIVAKAEARAQDIITAAEARAVDIEASVKQIADDQWIRFVDVDAVDQAARALQTMISTSTTIRADFETFTPWMQSFVQDAVTRIIGAVPPATMWSGLLHQSLSDIQDRWSLVLRVHPSHATLLKAVIQADPILKDAFKDVHPDRNLEKDDCLIEGSQGVTDVSLKTQIGALLMALEDAVERDISHRDAGGM